MDAVSTGSGREWALTLETAGGGFCIPRGGAAFVPLPTRIAGSLYVTVNYRLNGVPAGTHKRRFIISGLTPRSLSGTWYDPASSGQGLMLTVAANGTAVQWNTYDENGNQMWISGFAPTEANPSEPDTLRASMFRTRSGSFASSTNVPSNALWGDVKIDYLACGRIRIEWLAQNSATFPNGAREFVQLTRTDDACALDPDMPEPGASIRFPSLRDG